jgi:hypothetical protein
MKGVLVQVGADMEEARARLWRGMVENLRHDLAAVVDTEPDSFGRDELCQRRRCDQQHYSARFARYHDALVDGARVSRQLPSAIARPAKYHQYLSLSLSL